MKNLKNPHLIARSIYLLTLVIVTICAVSINPLSTVAESSPMTYQNPLAYVGTDGNYYVTSMERLDATSVTSDMVVQSGNFIHVEPYNHYGSRPHWSPQGTQFAFVNDGALYVVQSDKPAKQVVAKRYEDNSSKYIYLDNSSFAWSPDGDYIAYAQGFAPDGLRIVQVNGTLVQKLTLSNGITATGGGGGGGGVGPGPERAYGLLEEERDDDFYTHGNIPLYWTNQGFLYSSGEIREIFVASNTGTIIWSSDFLDNMIVSPDNTRVLGSADATNPDDPVMSLYDGFGNGILIQPVLLDLASGKNLSLPLSVGTEPLAWTPDGKSIIFGTKTLYKKIDATNKGNDLTNYRPYFDYTLTLWRQGLDEKYPTMLFQHEGYDFGWVTISPDDTTVVFSLISNNVFDKVDPESQIIAVPINSGQPQWIAIGGKPAFGNGSFTAVPAISSSLTPSVTCPNSLLPRLKIGQRAKVTPGEPNSLRSLPAGGGELRSLSAGSVFLVLDGPTCGSDGLAWWKVNYRGIVGWTAESDKKSYWLEQ